MRFFVLPAAKHILVDMGIDAVRKSGRSLSTACDLLIETLKTEAVLKTKANLIDGRRYGLIDVSYGANAWRNGRLLLNHGEIYEYIYTYDEGNGFFYGVNAWGTPYFANIRDSALLIEL